MGKVYIDRPRTRAALFLGAVMLLFLETLAAASTNSSPNDDLAAASKAVLKSPGLSRRDQTGDQIKIIKAERLLHLPFGPVLITSVTIRDAAYAEHGALGIHYLRRTGLRYHVVKSWPEAVDGAPHGEPPKWGVTNKFTLYPAILAEAETGLGGLYCGSAEIMEFRPEGPTRSAIDLSVTQLDPDQNPMRELKGRITNIRRGQSFEVRVTGTRRFTERYVYRKNRFIVLSAPPQLTCE